MLSINFILKKKDHGAPGYEVFSTPLLEIDTVTLIALFGLAL
jgi:hypothetical protein